MQLTRTLLFPLESLTHGLIYGLAQYHIRNPRPLDSNQNWEFWTAQKGPLVTAIINDYPPKFVRKLLVEVKFLLPHEAGIAAHYDISNEFYELFLDRRHMFYSCADFNDGNETLEEAQENKANYLLKLIEPRQGERILELGCGWGAMLRHIYQVTDDKQNLFGYTLSRKQVEYIRERDGFNVSFTDFITATYENESFDKMYSIGAWEHVRPHEIPVLLKKLYQALKPGGRLVKQFFCLPGRAFPSSQVLGKIFFPGSALAPYQYHIESAREVGFRVIHESKHDYRKTLESWYQNLTANKDRAIELKGVRNYNKYLIFFASAWKMFDVGHSEVHRLVLERPR